MVSIVQVLSPCVHPNVFYYFMSIFHCASSWATMHTTFNFCPRPARNETNVYQYVKDAKSNTVLIVGYGKEVTICKKCRKRVSLCLVRLPKSKAWQQLQYVNSDLKQMLLINDHSKTIFGHYFAVCIFIFHKTEVQKVILRCLMSLNLNWYKRYDTKCK